MFKHSQYISSKHDKSYEQQKLNHASCKNVKGWDLRVQTQCRHGDFLSVVPIGGAIVHPR